MDLSERNVSSIADSIGQYVKHLQFGSKSQLAFLEDLYVLVNDGIPPNRAIDMMSKIATGLNRDVAASIAQKISEGQPLAEGMRDWFKPNIIEIIRVGEEGGGLAQTMESAITSMTRQTGTMGAFIGALIYPFFVLILACSIIVYLNKQVFTQFKMIKPVAEWPESGRYFIEIAALIQQWWWLVAVLVIGLIVLLRWLMVNYVGEMRTFLDQIPPFLLYRRLVAAQFLETLGLLVANGVVFKNALRVIEQQANPYLAFHLVEMEHLLSMGRGNVADVLATGLIDEADVMRLRVMAEVKGFEHGLTRMGLLGAEKTTKTLRVVGKIFGGMLLVVDFSLIILMVVAIMGTGQAMGS